MGCVPATGQVVVKWVLSHRKLPSAFIEDRRLNSSIDDKQVAYDYHKGDD